MKHIFTLLLLVCGVVSAQQSNYLRFFSNTASASIGILRNIDKDSTSLLYQQTAQTGLDRYNGAGYFTSDGKWIRILTSYAGQTKSSWLNNAMVNSGSGSKERIKDSYVVIGLNGNDNGITFSMNQAEQVSAQSYFGEGYFNSDGYWVRKENIYNVITGIHMLNPNGSKDVYTATFTSVPIYDKGEGKALALTQASLATDFSILDNAIIRNTAAASTFNQGLISTAYTTNDNNNTLSIYKTLISKMVVPESGWKADRFNYSSFGVLPSVKNQVFQFVDNQVEGAVEKTRLTTTYFSANYSNQIAANEDNGAIKIYRAAYRESYFGSGNVSWLDLKAPVFDESAALIRLNTFGNLAKDNYLGAIRIATTADTYLQMATTSINSGIIGFNNTTDSKLELSASNVFTAGSFSSAGVISTNTGISVTTLGVEQGLKITSSSIGIYERNYNDYIGRSYNGLNNSLVISTNRPDGISFNAFSNNGTANINFSLNGNSMIQVIRSKVIVIPGDQEYSFEDGFMYFPKKSKHQIINSDPSFFRCAWSEDGKFYVSNGKDWFEACMRKVTEEEKKEL